MSNLKDKLSSLQERAKERTVKTQGIEYDLETLVKKISKDIIKLDPEYQRRHRWDDETSSKLIESLILNIPIPTVYLSQDFDVDTETEESRYSVIDGQQRLTAIKNFFNGKFPLQGLESLEELNGCYYKDLPPFLIRRLEERTIKCLRIDSTVDDKVKIDIFERLNSGSVKLESQELRNAIYSGPFNNLCKTLAGNETYRKLLQINLESPENSSRVKKMEDVEIVLRFFSLVRGRYKSFKKTKEKGFKDFLSDSLGEFNKVSQDSLAEWGREFIEIMELIYSSFGATAFAKYKFEEGELKLQSKFNVAVFDALAVACFELKLAGIKDFTGKKEKFLELFKDGSFYDSISGSYLDVAKLNFRIDISIATLK
ncbi:MAG: DUF262 domain-containing protein [Chitinophagales bacterium]